MNPRKMKDEAIFSQNVFSFCEATNQLVILCADEETLSFDIKL